MFTGLIEEVGKIESIRVQGETAVLRVQAPKVSHNARLGDSVAINGVCLTVTHMDGEALSFEAVPETLRRSNLGDLQNGDPVNLERPLSAEGRFGGHFVQGHVDGVGIIDEVRDEQNARIFFIQVPPPLTRYLIEKGSVAVDGTSLTIASIEQNRFSVWIIPHTLAHTCFGARKTGDRVNLEVDLLAKYVEKMLSARA